MSTDQIQVLMVSPPWLGNDCHLCCTCGSLGTSAFSPTHGGDSQLSAALVFLAVRISDKALGFCYLTVFPPFWQGTGLAALGCLKI